MRREKISVLRKYIFPVFICLILAVLVWVSVMRIGYTKEFDGIAVTVTGVDQRFEVKAKTTVDNVCFRGNKSSFSGIESENIKAYVDVSALAEPGVYEIALTFSTPADIKLETPVYFTVELVEK